MITVKGELWRVMARDGASDFLKCGILTNSQKAKRGDAK